MAETTSFVLDSFALLAYLQDESAASRIEKLLENAEKEKYHLFFSLINLGELLYITERRGGVAKAQDTLALIRQLPIEIVPADEPTVFAAAHIKANHLLSYADAFVAAIAIEKNASILTGDPEFQSVETLATIEWLEITDL
jgi:predicted nucleic acid-binding protein